MASLTAKRTVLFLPESAHGATNNCVGIGDVLRRRGHRVVFAADTAWEGRFASLGFEEALMRIAPGDDGSGDRAPDQFWRDHVAWAAPEFKRSTVDQVETVLKPVHEALIQASKQAEPQLKKVLAEVRPDVVVQDNPVLFPALAASEAAFVRLVSCNPLEMPGEDVPPTFSGLAVGDRETAAAFRAEFERVFATMWDEFDTWVREQGADTLPYLHFMPEGDRNLYVYPEIADYVDRRPLHDNWSRLESSVRRTEEPFQIPKEISKGNGSLVYLSLGSLGAADVELMQRVIDTLALTGHRYIVSMGPRHEDIRLAENMWGAEFLPQPSILPLVDLVITHGGNNTLTECFHFGKPTVVLPLCWDQHDNAQRVQELGFGVRLDPYRFAPVDLREAIERLLGNARLRQQLHEIGAKIRARDGVSRAADIIEEAQAAA